MSIADDDRPVDDAEVQLEEADDEVVAPLPEDLSIPLEVSEGDAIEQALEVDTDEIYPREDSISRPQAT